MTAPDCFDVVDVLTSPGTARQELCARIDLDDSRLDALLVSDLLRESGRVAATLRTRAALVELCSLVRALDAARSGRIDLDDLRRGVGAHGWRTDGFVGFHEVGVLLRTLLEVLEHAAARQDQRPVRAQVDYLHDELRAWLVTQLTGSLEGTIAPMTVAPAPDPRGEWLVRDPETRHAMDQYVRELLHGSGHRPASGVLGAAWVRGWSAVPVAGEMLGDDPAELGRLDAALDALDGGRPRRLLQVDRDPPPRWHLQGTRMLVHERVRRSWSMPADADGIAAAAADRRGWTIITSDRLDFAYVEGPDHHAVLAPPHVAEVLCGIPPLEALARFREHVEGLAVDGAPPAELLELAERFGRLRRRSR